MELKEVLMGYWMAWPKDAAKAVGREQLMVSLRAKLSDDKTETGKDRRLASRTAQKKAALKETPSAAHCFQRKGMLPAKPWV